jgi:hypothetical protein
LRIIGGYIFYPSTGLFCDGLAPEARALTGFRASPQPRRRQAAAPVVERGGGSVGVEWRRGGVAARWCRQGGEASNNEEEEPRKGAAARCRVDAGQKREVKRVRERGVEWRHHRGERRRRKGNGGHVTLGRCTGARRLRHQPRDARHPTVGVDAPMQETERGEPRARGRERAVAGGWQGPRRGST